MPNFHVVQPAVDLIDVAIDNADQDWTEAFAELVEDLNDWCLVATWTLATDVATREPSLTWTVDARDLYDVLGDFEADDIAYEVRPA